MELSYKRGIFLLFLLSETLYIVMGSGSMYDPPNRAVMWKYGFETQKSYDYMQLNCGGKKQHEMGNPQCGVCGDAVDMAKDHERGGKYGTGTISRYYPAGVKEISVKVELLAFEKGFFEFRLCPANNNTVTQQCLDEYLLPIKEGYLAGNPLRYFPKNAGDFRLTVAIPPSLLCDRCVIQWRYHTGNSWGEDAISGDQGLGLGLQEEFYNCADIRIGGDVPKSVMNNPFFTPKDAMTPVKNIVQPTIIDADPTGAGSISHTPSDPRAIPGSLNTMGANSIHLQTNQSLSDIAGGLMNIATGTVLPPIIQPTQNPVLSVASWETSVSAARAASTSVAPLMVGETTPLTSFGLSNVAPSNAGSESNFALDNILSPDPVNANAGSTVKKSFFSDIPIQPLADTGAAGILSRPEVVYEPAIDQRESTTHAQGKTPKKLIPPHIKEQITKAFRQGLTQTTPNGGNPAMESAIMALIKHQLGQPTDGSSTAATLNAMTAGTGTGIVSGSSTGANPMPTLGAAGNFGINGIDKMTSMSGTDSGHVGTSTSGFSGFHSGGIIGPNAGIKVANGSGLFSMSLDTSKVDTKSLFPQGTGSTTPMTLVNQPVANVGFDTGSSSKIVFVDTTADKQASSGFSGSSGSSNTFVDRSSFSESSSRQVLNNMPSSSNTVMTIDNVSSMDHSGNKILTDTNVATTKGGTQDSAKVVMVGPTIDTNVYDHSASGSMATSVGMGTNSLSHQAEQPIANTRDSSTSFQTFSTHLTTNINNQPINGIVSEAVGIAGNTVTQGETMTVSTSHGPSFSVDPLNANANTATVYDRVPVSVGREGTTLTKHEIQTVVKTQPTPILIESFNLNTAVGVNNPTVTAGVPPEATLGIGGENRQRIIESEIKMPITVEQPSINMGTTVAQSSVESFIPAFNRNTLILPGLSHSSSVQIDTNANVQPQATGFESTQTMEPSSSVVSMGTQNGTFLSDRSFIQGTSMDNVNSFVTTRQIGSAPVETPTETTNIKTVISGTSSSGHMGTADRPAEVPPFLSGRLNVPSSSIHIDTGVDVSMTDNNANVVDTSNQLNTVVLNVQSVPDSNTRNIKTMSTGRIDTTGVAMKTPSIFSGGVKVPVESQTTNIGSTGVTDNMASISESINKLNVDRISTNKINTIGTSAEAPVLGVDKATDTVDRSFHTTSFETNKAPTENTGTFDTTVHNITFITSGTDNSVISEPSSVNIANVNIMPQGNTGVPGLSSTSTSEHFATGSSLNPTFTSDQFSVNPSSNTIATRTMATGNTFDSDNIMTDFNGDSNVGTVHTQNLPASSGITTNIAMGSSDVAVATDVPASVLNKLSVGPSDPSKVHIDQGAVVWSNTSTTAIDGSNQMTAVESVPNIDMLNVPETANVGFINTVSPGQGSNQMTVVESVPNVDMPNVPITANIGFINTVSSGQGSNQMTVVESVPNVDMPNLPVTANVGFINTVSSGQTAIGVTNVGSGPISAPFDVLPEPTGVTDINSSSVAVDTPSPSPVGTITMINSGSTNTVGTGSMNKLPNFLKDRLNVHGTDVVIDTTHDSASGFGGNTESTGASSGTTETVSFPGAQSNIVGTTRGSMEVTGIGMAAQPPTPPEIIISNLNAGVRGGNVNTNTFETLDIGTNTNTDMFNTHSVSSVGSPRSGGSTVIETLVNTFKPAPFVPADPSIAFAGTTVHGSSASTSDVSNVGSTIQGRVVMSHDNTATDMTQNIDNSIAFGGNTLQGSSSLAAGSIGDGTMHTGVSFSNVGMGTDVSNIGSTIQNNGGMAAAGKIATTDNLIAFGGNTLQDSSSSKVSGIVDGTTDMSFSNFDTGMAVSPIVDSPISVGGNAGSTLTDVSFSNVGTGMGVSPIVDSSSSMGGSDIQGSSSVGVTSIEGPSIIRTAGDAIIGGSTFNTASTSHVNVAADNTHGIPSLPSPSLPDTPTTIGSITNMNNLNQGQIIPGAVISRLETASTIDQTGVLPPFGSLSSITASTMGNNDVVIDPGTAPFELLTVDKSINNANIANSISSQSVDNSLITGSVGKTNTDMINNAQGSGTFASSVIPANSGFGTIDSGANVETTVVTNSKIVVNDFSPNQFQVSGNVASKIAKALMGGKRNERIVSITDMKLFNGSSTVEPFVTVSPISNSNVGQNSFIDTSPIEQALDTGSKSNVGISFRSNVLGTLETKTPGPATIPLSNPVPTQGMGSIVSGSTQGMGSNVSGSTQGMGSIVSGSTQGMGSIVSGSAQGMDSFVSGSTQGMDRIVSGSRETSISQSSSSAVDSRVNKETLAQSGGFGVVETSAINNGQEQRIYLLKHNGPTRSEIVTSGAEVVNTNMNNLDKQTLPVFPGMNPDRSIAGSAKTVVMEDIKPITIGVAPSFEISAGTGPSGLIQDIGVSVTKPLERDPFTVQNINNVDKANSVVYTEVSTGQGQRDAVKLEKVPLPVIATIVPSSRIIGGQNTVGTRTNVVVNNAANKADISTVPNSFAVGGAKINAINVVRTETNGKLPRTLNLNSLGIGTDFRGSRPNVVVDLSKVNENRRRISVTTRRPFNPNARPSGTSTRTPPMNIVKQLGSFDLRRIPNQAAIDAGVQMTSGGALTSGFGPAQRPSDSVRRENSRRLQMDRARSGVPVVSRVASGGTTTTETRPRTNGPVFKPEYFFDQNGGTGRSTVRVVKVAGTGGSRRTSPSVTAGTNLRMNGPRVNNGGRTNGQSSSSRNINVQVRPSGNGMGARTGTIAMMRDSRIRSTGNATRFGGIRRSGGRGTARGASARDFTIRGLGPSSVGIVRRIPGLRGGGIPRPRFVPDVSGMSMGTGPVMGPTVGFGPGTRMMTFGGPLMEIGGGLGTGVVGEGFRGVPELGGGGFMFGPDGTLIRGPMDGSVFGGLPLGGGFGPFTMI